MFLTSNDYLKKKSIIFGVVLFSPPNEIATSKVYFPQKAQEYENNAFVYNSYFTQEDYPNIHGGITDNRINYNYRGLKKRTH